MREPCTLARVLLCQRPVVQPVSDHAEYANTLLLEPECLVEAQSVIVGEKGRVDADIIADSVVLSGTVNGHITAKAKLEITTNGKLKGDIKTGSLIIAEGVLFEGKCQMITDEQVFDPPALPLAEEEEIQPQ